MKDLAMKFAMMSFAMLLAGCTDSNELKASSDNAEAQEWTVQGHGAWTKAAEVDGHKYVLLVGTRLGGIVHAESCSCKTGRK